MPLRMARQQARAAVAAQATFQAFQSQALKSFGAPGSGYFPGGAAAPGRSGDGGMASRADPAWSPSAVFACGSPPRSSPSGSRATPLTTTGTLHKPCAVSPQRRTTPSSPHPPPSFRSPRPDRQPVNISSPQRAANLLSPRSEMEHLLCSDDVRAWVDSVVEKDQISRLTRVQRGMHRRLTRRLASHHRAHLLPRALAGVAMGAGSTNAWHGRVACTCG